MASRICSVVLHAVFLLILSASTGAVNITRALGRYPDFSTMKEMFSKSGLTEIINKRNSITILAVDNEAMSAISGRPEEEIKNILMNHVVLDYYDEFKFKEIKARSTLLTTLYQATGRGQQLNGFLKVSKTSDGTLAFGSGAKGSPDNALFIKPVFHNPYNLSIVQVSMPIVAPGIGDPLRAPPPPPASPPSPPPESSPVAAPGPAPSDANETPAPAPSKEPTASPAPAPAPSKGRKVPTADEVEPNSSGASFAHLHVTPILVLGPLLLIVGL